MKFNKINSLFVISIFIILSLFVTAVSNPTEPDTITKNKNKLNIETETFFKNTKDKEQQKEFIIKFKENIDESKLSKVSTLKNIDRFKVTKVKGKVKHIEELLDDSEIEFVELEQNIRSLEETIPFNIKNIKADYVWNLSKGSNVKVAVLDTGISNHNDLLIAGGHSVISANYNDNNGHGTAVAGVISAIINDKGIIGVAHEIGLYAVKIMESSSGSLSDAIAGLEWAINNNMSIVSMSFGFESYSQIFKAFVQEAYDNNILLVGAAGNNYKDNILYPARYDKVIAVGAVDENSEKVTFSSHGFDMELVAPGVNIYSTSLNNGYTFSSGTSLATPHVAGAAALIKAYNKSLTNEQIRAKLRNDALDLGDKGWDWLYGYGLVQANLDIFNFTLQNDSYYYEIYNITNYNTPLERNILWIKNTGHIDDVYFNLGIYLVNITKFDVNKKYYYDVKENGTLILLNHAINLSDTYTIACPSGVDCKHDAIVFLNGVLKAKNIPQTGETILAECFDWINGGFYDSCYGSQTDINNCRANTTFDTTCTNAATGCTSQGSQGEQTVPTSVSQGLELDSLYCYSSAGYKVRGQPNRFHYICNARQYVCTSSTQYEDRCSYTPNSVKVIGTVTCPSGTFCDTTADESNADFGTNGNSIPTSPCRSVCTGKAFVGIDNQKDSNMAGYNVSVNGVFNGTTNAGGLEVNFNSVFCGNTQTIDVYCSNNNTKLCQQKTTSMDFNGDNDSLVFNCNVCNNNKNIKISLADINYREVLNNLFEFNITINNENVASSFNVTIRGQDKTTGITSTESSKTETISNSSQTTFNSLINLTTANIDYVHVYVDAKNNIIEAIETDNYVIVPFIKKKEKAYIEVGTGNSKADEAIKAYLKLFFDEKAENQADFIISIGRNTAKFNSLNDYTKNNLKWYYDKTKNVPYFNNNPVGFTAYSGLVGRFFKDGKSHVFAYGKNIEGDVAAVKKLISAKNILLVRDPFNVDFDARSAAKFTIVVDEKDVTGLAVMDLMHRGEAHSYYNAKSGTNGDRFKEIVEKILLDNNFEIAIKTVQTTNDNTTLRLKNVNSDFSVTFKDAILNTSTPVVFSGGGFSDLFRWEEESLILRKPGLATQLAKEGRDIWEIELNGGPKTECDTCPDYKYEEQVDYYWPSLISGVEKYSGQHKIQYVGLSHGCRVALDSLKNWSNGKNNAGYYFDTSTGTYQLTDLSSNIVDTFVGVACIGAFNGSSTFAEGMQERGDNVISEYEEDGENHSKLSTLAFKLRKFDIGLITFLEKEKVSLNLIRKYKNWIDDSSDIQPGKNVSINYVSIIYGDCGGRLCSSDSNSDMLVPTNDAISIFNNLNTSSNTAFLSKFRIRHFGMPEDDDVKEVIRKNLNKEVIK